ncbi:sigma-70 family RNA polymerase sigma factor [Humibacillus xanthopallidus]|uniref:sigma-70 family RNA polymerase sigma factor n=1 Tax=Humibacillus xanthopallidus TaxID=412689 RepID=UPI00384BEFF2
MAHVRSLAAATPAGAPVVNTSGSPAAEAETSFPSVHAERDAETAELFAALAAAPDGRSRAVALERIVLLYLDLCGSMASRYDGRGIEHDDLVQVARLALVKAIDRYVPGQGPSFAAFAVPTISGELKRHFRDRGWMVRPPRRLQEMRVQVQSCRNRLEQEVGHTPTDADVARELGVTRAAVKEAVAASSSFHPTSLDASTTDDESGSVAYLLGDDDESLARVEDRVCLSAALSGLDADERQLLALRYVDELTQREIGVQLGMSQMQVSRALRRLVAHLRVALADDPTTGRRRLGQAS